MGRFSLRALALLMVVLLLPVGSAWTQLHGDAQRSGLLAVPDGPLDVVAYHRFLPATETFNSLQGPALVPTPHGLMGFGRVTSDDSCVLLRIDLENGDNPIRTPLDECTVPWFQGYDAPTDTLLTCAIAEASASILQARDPLTGALKWAISPIRDLGVIDTELTHYWGCTGVAIDSQARVAAAIFLNVETGLDVYRHRVALIDLDTGGVIWYTQVPRSSEFTGGQITGQPGEVEGPGAGLIPLTATMTATGILVTGVIICLDVVTCDQPTPRTFTENENFGPFMTATAWMTMDGEVRGMASSRLDIRSDDLASDVASRTAGGAFSATASGSLGAISAGGYITIVNPEDRNWLVSEPVSRLESPRWGIDPFAAPVWGEDAIFVPFYRTVSAFDPLDLRQKWAWATDEAGLIVGDATVATSGQLIVLATKTPRTTQAQLGSQGNESLLVRIDGATGRELQRLPMVSETWMTTEEPFGIPESGREDFRYPRPPVIVPIEDGLLIVDLTGNAVEVRAATPENAPQFAVADAFPRPNRPIELSVPSQQGTLVEAVYVQWGDGKFDHQDMATLGSDGVFRLHHAFTAVGVHEMILTAVFADGTTRSATSLINVGGSPAPPLNFVEKALLPENYDLTFGVLGIVLAATGGLWAAQVRSRRRGWLRRKIIQLDELAKTHRDAPHILRALLEEERQDLRDRALRGQIEGASLNLLERRIDTLASASRMGIIEGELSFLPYALAKRLQEIVRDNRVDEQELQNFIRALEAEVDLSLAQRIHVERVVATWFDEDAKSATGTN